MRSLVLCTFALLLASCAPALPPSHTKPGSTAPGVSQKVTGTPAWSDGDGDFAEAAAVLATEEDFSDFRNDHPLEKRMGRTESTYSNILVLDGMTAERLIGSMFGMHRALDVRCPYCHDPQDFASDEKAEKKTSRQMLLMARHLNDSAFQGEMHVTCWTCHRGREKPDSHPADLAKRAAAIAIPGGLKAPDDEKMLAKDEYKNLEKLGKMPAKNLLPAMQMMAVSIGKDCSFCHDPSAFESDEKKAKQIARSMLRLTAQTNAEIFQTPNDKDSVTCWTCHRGSLHPEVLPGKTELPGHEQEHRKPDAHEHEHEHEPDPSK